MEPATPEVVVGWFTLSLIVAGIAQGKNGIGILWWFFAILTGPLALFVLVLLPKK